MILQTKKKSSKLPKEKRQKVKSPKAKLPKLPKLNFLRRKAKDKQNALKGKKIGTQLNWVFSAGLLITIAVIVCFVNILTMQILEKDFQQSCIYNMNAILNYQETEITELQAAIKNIATSPNVMSAMREDVALASYRIADEARSYVNGGKNADILALDQAGSKIYSSSLKIDTLMSGEFAKAALGGEQKSSIAILSDHIYAVSATPISQYGTVVGATIGISRLDDDASLDSLNSVTGADYTVFIGDKYASTTIVRDNRRQTGATMAPKFAEQILQQGKTYVGKSNTLGEEYMVNYVPLKNSKDEILGALFAGKNLADVNRQTNTITLAAAAIGLLIFIVTDLILMRFLKRNIASPLGRIVRLSEEVASGNLGLSQTLDDSYTHNAQNEIGKVFYAQLQTVESVRSYIGEIDRVLTDLSKGKLNSDIELTYTGDFINIRNALMQVQDKLTGAMTEINQTSTTLSISADEIAAASQALSQGAAEQAGSVELLDTTTASIYRSVQDTAGNAHQAKEKIYSVGQSVREGDEKVSEMLTAMQQIKQSSDKIGKIVKTIEDIAFQTNILALNAAVEAARAGAAGKGFAVVADEVRNLAGKSAAAVRDTTDLIENSLQAVSAGSQKAGEAAKVMDQTVGLVTEVISVIENISTANDRQAVSLGQIQSQVAQISQAVSMTSASAEESAATAEELAAQAKLLEQLVAAFERK